MNNEEKIFNILEELSKGQEQLFKGQEELKQRVTKTEILIENTVIPQIQILAEGQKTIQEQIRHLSVIDAMQDDIATLKAAVKFLSREVDDMKKAI